MLNIPEATRFPRPTRLTRKQSYSLFEPLTNILLKRFRPKWFLTGTMVLWGIVMTFMGFVQDYRGLTAARFFLGVAEAGKCKVFLLFCRICQTSVFTLYRLVSWYQLLSQLLVQAF